MVTTSSDGRRRTTLGVATSRILNGFEDLTDWDDEEILRGQRRSKRGRFEGAPPQVVPQQVHEERVRRSMARAGKLLRENTEKAIRVLIKIIDDDDVAPHTRLNAIEMLLSRTLPKSIDLTLSIDTEPTFLKVLRGSMVGLTTSLELGPGDGSPIIDAEVIDDDELTYEEA